MRLHCKGGAVCIDEKKGLDSVYCLNDLKVTSTVVHSKIR